MVLCQIKHKTCVFTCKHGPTLKNVWLKKNRKYYTDWLLINLLTYLLTYVIGYWKLDAIVCRLNVEELSMLLMASRSTLCTNKDLLPSFSALVRFCLYTPPPAPCLYWRSQDPSVEGALKVVYGVGCPLPIEEGVWEGLCPIFRFLCKNGGLGAFLVLFWGNIA